MNEIKSITIVSQSGVSKYVVGKNSIKEIIDRTNQFPSGMFTCYKIYNTYNKLVAKIENCPIEVCYK